MFDAKQRTTCPALVDKILPLLAFFTTRFARGNGVVVDALHTSKAVLFTTSPSSNVSAIAYRREYGCKRRCGA